LLSPPLCGPKIETAHMEFTVEQLRAALAELQLRMDHALPAMRPFLVEMASPMPRESRRKASGVTRAVTFDIDGELYQHLQVNVPETAVLRGILWIEDAPAEMSPAMQLQAPGRTRRNSSAPRLAPAGNSEWAFFWNDFRQHVLRMEGVADALQVVDQNEWAATLRARYGAVQSMSEIDPAVMIADLEAAGLKKAPARCRQIIADLAAEAQVSMFLPGRMRISGLEPSHFVSRFCFRLFITFRARRLESSFPEIGRAPHDPS